MVSSNRDFPFHIYCKREEKRRAHIIATTNSGKTIYAECLECGSTYTFNVGSASRYKKGSKHLRGEEE